MASFIWHIIYILMDAFCFFGILQEIKTLENAGFITKCIPENFDYALGQLTWEGHKLLKKLRKKERKAQKKSIKESEYQITPEEEAEIKEQFGDIQL